MKKSRYTPEQGPSPKPSAATISKLRTLLVNAPSVRGSKESELRC